MARMRSKSDLPTKDCVTCGRPFAWRKKWARDWENVKHCSDACRSGARCAPSRKVHRLGRKIRGEIDGHAAEASECPDQVSAEEWAIRVDLAAAYRLVALYGWDDMIFTHLSARVPGPEHHFLINPYNLMFEEITASSLVKIDVEGHPVMETPYHDQPGRLHHPFGDPHGARRCACGDAPAHPRRPGGERPGRKG